MLINCVAYQDGKKLQDISVEQISDYVQRPDCFVWVALKDPEPDELTKMQEEFHLHGLAVEDAHHGHQRPKIEEYGDSVFAVLHMVELEDGELNVGELDIFVGSNYILSVRNRAKQGFLGVRERAEREPHLLQHGSGFVFYALMDAVVDRYFPVLDALETDLEHIEEQIFSKTAARTTTEQLYDLKRKVVVLKHAVSPLMEAVNKLYGGRVPAVCATTQEYFRDVYDHLYRINTTIEGIRDTISTAIQASISLAAIEESEVTKRLASWAAIFGVATAFVGIWGMNFEFMPELKWKYGYAMALGLVAAVCGYMYYRFKKSGWL
ncbi:MAG: magnesium/cobalt transporter CorA [Burkholderiales bacterium]|nr:magnesium/cobalt transporter CorA [Burkholderiales bacterium]